MHSYENPNTENFSRADSFFTDIYDTEFITPRVHNPKVHSSIYETVETQLYVCNKCTTKKICITSYFKVSCPCYAKGNHKRHIKHMTVDNT